MRRTLLFFLTMFLFVLTRASVVLPSVFSDNMVLQQNSLVKFWGWSDPSEEVSILTGWNSKTWHTAADRSGRWMIQVSTGPAGGPFSIVITARNRIEIRNVMLGEVWFCGGQSNMDWSFYNLGGWKYYQKLKSSLGPAESRSIRLCTVAKNTAAVPKDSCNVLWKTADTENILYFSATAFCYGLELFHNLKVPVGLITSSWGGTPAEAWTPVEYMKYTKGLAFYLTHPNEPKSQATAPSALFNAMIYPLRNFTVRGFIWYQGEANRMDADLYGTLFRAMITGWRKYWGNPSLPFYFVQIAPFNYNDMEFASGYLREAQSGALELDYTGMVVTLDIGDPADIHPKNKQEVGRRLAMLALSGTYGQSLPVSPLSPSYWFAKTEKDKIQVFFRNTEGFLPKPGGLSGFLIAGKDGIFRPATAVVAGSSVVVYNKEIANPSYVRYAFRNTDTASLFDRYGLPAGSFRTDSILFRYP